MPKGEKQKGPMTPEHERQLREASKKSPWRGWRKMVKKRRKQ